MSEKLYCVTDLKGSPIQTAFTDGSFCFRAEPKVASEVAQVEAVFNTPLSYSVRKRLAVAGKKVAVQNL